MSYQTRSSPRKRPKQDRSKETVDAILNAAAHILTEDGYDNANTNRIAKRAGVSAGSLYQYFLNKEAIITTLRERHINEMMEVVKSAWNKFINHPLEVVLYEIVEASIAAHAVAPTLHRILDKQVPRLSQSVAEAKINTLLRKLLEQKSDQIQVRNIEYTVFILERTIESLAHAAVIGHPEFLEEQLETEITKLLLLYLKG